MSSGYFNMIANQPSQIIGPAGVDGATWYYSTGVPVDTTGSDGDFNLQDNGDVYQRVTGTWGSPLFSLQGPKGDKGDIGLDGVDGNTVLNGIIPPNDITDGVDGDFYIDTSVSMIYGPKTGGVWGTGTSLIGTTDHSQLINLINDDHPQYHNDVRGDIRYTPISHINDEPIHRINYKVGVVVSVDTIVSSWDVLLVDTRNQTVTVTLPPNPLIGDKILLIDAEGRFNVNALTVLHNGNNIRGSLNDYTATTRNFWIEFIYTGANRGWNYRADR